MPRTLSFLFFAPLVAAVFALAAHSALAQRQLPQDSLYVKRAEFNYPFVKLGKQVIRLAVGSRIYNKDNLIIVPASAPRSADVLYKKDINGEISQIWILTPEESRYFAKNPPKPAAQ